MNFEQLVPWWFLLTKVAQMKGRSKWCGSAFRNSRNPFNCMHFLGGDWGGIQPPKLFKAVHAVVKLA